MNMHPSSTGSCSKGASFKHPQNTLRHLCFSLIQRILLLCSFWIMDLCRLFIFYSIYLFILVRYEIQNMPAQNWLLPDSWNAAWQELRAPLSNQCVLCLLWHRRGHTAGFYVVYNAGLYTHATGRLSLAHNLAGQQLTTENFQHTKYFCSFSVEKNSGREGSEGWWRPHVPPLHKERTGRK